VTSFESQVKKLSLDRLRNIETHYYKAIDARRGSGDHFILIGELSNHGFRTNSVEEAMEIADKIIVTWYKLNQ